MSLSEISLLLFGKPKETDGNEIEELYKNGNVDEIVKHNILDLEITEAIYLMRDDLLTEGGRRFECSYPGNCIFRKHHKNVRN